MWVAMQTRKKMVVAIHIALFRVDDYITRMEIGKQTKQIEQKKEVKQIEREQKKNANKRLTMKGRRRYLESICTKRN